jgi:hypothetical protein
MSSVDAQLSSKGWQRVEGNGDVALTAVGATQTFYDGLGPGWFWRGFGDQATITVVTHKVGTLVLDMYDTKTHKLIWRGTASDTLSKKPEKNEDKLDKCVEKMSHKFPPGEKD